jgi:hypothetical protein
VIVARTCGSTYGLSLLSATLSANLSRAVWCPHPLMRGIESRRTPRLLAYFSAYARDARKTAADPSVTCEQSATRIRPPIAALNSSREQACALFMYQVRVCASGFSLAFA